MIPLNDLSRALDIHEREFHSKILNVVGSGSYILGSRVAEFETAFSAYIGQSHVLAVASGTDAIEIGLRSIGVVSGDIVATTPNAGGYVSKALLQIGAKGLFIDCLESGQMDPENLSKTLESTPGVKAVFTTHLFGMVGHLPEIRSICDGFRVPLLEDCAQSAGATINGVRAGSFGDVATFSFYPTKNLGALGDCGALGTSSDEVARRIQRLRQYGWSDRYKVEMLSGTNSRMDEIQAAILISRLPNLDHLNQVRRSIWSQYSNALEGSRWRMIGSNDPSFVGHLAVVVAPEGLRDKSRGFLESCGVSTSIHYPILDYHQPAWSELLSGYCPVAERLAEQIFSIPLFPMLTQDEVKQISDALVRMSLEVRF